MKIASTNTLYDFYYSQKYALTLTRCGWEKLVNFGQSKTNKNVFPYLLYQKAFITTSSCSVV